MKLAAMSHVPWDGKPRSPDYGAIRRAYVIDGVKVASTAEFKPVLESAIKSKRPVVIDVHMQNEPVPTAGHWNIMDIYSPGKRCITSTPLIEAGVRGRRGRRRAPAGVPGTNGAARRCRAALK